MKIDKLKPEWANSIGISALLPIILLGQWNENVPGDLKLVEKLSGKTYSDYSKILQGFRLMPDSPIANVGTVWRLKSPMDAMSYASVYLTNDDLVKLKEICLLLIADDDPDAEDKVVSDKWKMWQFKQQFSSDVKKGTYQSLILLSLINDEGDSRNIWVDGLVRELLKSWTLRRFLSNRMYFPLLAEASPEAFLEFLEETGSTFVSASDTEVIVKLIAKRYKEGLERALTDTIQMIKGSFALCVMTENTLIGVRDPNGIRPLCLGKLENGWMLASESCAIEAVGGTLVRDIRPGEIVIINEDGVLSFEFGEHTAKRTCIFEYVYFARPDSIIDTISVQDARLRMGAVLARESGVPADVVIGVPDSGLGAAMGYARESGIPYAMGIVKNKYIGRTFIAPTQSEREQLVFVKLNAMKSDVCGKRVVIIDDSIVRGTTCRRLIQILRRAGAKEVHFRVSSPPVKFPCYFGIDTPCRADLISSSHNVDEVCKEIGADSLAFISIDGMFEALKECCPESYGYCKGCFTGEYPIPVPGELNGRRI